MFKDDHGFFKHAALELQSLDDHEVVKIASVFRRMKNWWKALGDPGYRQKVKAISETSPSIKSLLTELHDNIDKLQKAISDRDVKDYGTTVSLVRDLTSRLAVALGNFQNMAGDVVESAPTVIVDNDGREYSEDYVDQVTRGYKKDKELLQRLTSQLPPGAPLPGRVNQLMQDIDWFKQFGARHIHINHRLASNLVNAVKKIVSTQGPVKISEEAAAQMVDPVAEQLIENFKQSFLNGYLYSYKFPNISNNMTGRSANQMEMAVNAGPVNIPGTTIYIDFPLVLAHDLLASAHPSEKISIWNAKNIRWSTYSGMTAGEMKKYEQSLHAAEQADEVIEAEFKEIKAQRFERLLKLSQDVWWKDPVSPVKGADLPMSFWIKFVQMAKRLEADPSAIAPIIRNESGFDPSARNFANGPNNPPVAQGLNQLIHNIATKMLGMSEETWRNLYKMSAEEQLPWVEKYFQKMNIKGQDAGGIYLKNFGGFYNPDGSLYAGKEAQERWKASAAGKKWMAENPDKEPFKRPEYQQKAIEQNAGLVENGRIMPAKLRSMVSSNVGGEIGSKLNTAIDMSRDTEVPPYQEPTNYQEPPVQPPAQPVQPPAQPAPQPQPDVQQQTLDQQFQNVMNIIQGGGPIQRLVKKAVLQNSLPTTDLTLKISGQDQNKDLFIKKLSTSLRNELDAEVSIHMLNDEVHVEASILGSKEASWKATKGLFDAVKQTFEDVLKRKMTIELLQQEGKSQLPLWSRNV